MNTTKTKNKLMATIITMLLFASMVLAVVPLANAVINPALSASSGSVGDKITVSGTADVASNTIMVYWNSLTSTPLASVIADATTKGFTVEVTIPAAPMGEHDIIMFEADTTGSGSVTTPPAVEKFTIVPAITLALSGNDVTVTGTGFNAGKDVEFTFGGAIVTVTVPTPVTTSATGGFTATFTLSATLTTGTYAITATDDGTTPATAAENLVFKAAPKITLDIDAGGVGQAVTVTGTDFSPLSDIELTYDGVIVATDPVLMTTNAAGGFTAIFNIPHKSASGSYDVCATDEDANSATAAFAFTLDPVITLTPAKGLPGDTITVTGANYPSAVNTIRITFAGTEVLTGVVTDAVGGFEVTFNVPATATTYGPYTVIAHDTATPSMTASKTFTVGAAITLTNSDGEKQTQGPSGTPLTVNGRGFRGIVNIFFIDYGVAPSASSLFISVKTQVTVNADGTFTTEVIIPSLPATGNYAVYAVDSYGNGATETITVNEVTKLVVEPVIGMPGETMLKVTGTKFSTVPGTTVSFIIGSYSLDQVYAVKLDGSFVETIVLPDIPAGKYEFTAYDTSGLSASQEIWVATPIVKANPAEVATGRTTKITGLGFDVYGTGVYTVTITIGGVDVTPAIPGGVGHTLLINGIDVLVPNMPDGKEGDTYEVVVTSSDGVIGKTTIVISKFTSLEVKPESTLRDSDVTLTGKYFTAQAGLTVTLEVFNADGDAVNIFVGQSGPFYTSTDNNGEFSITERVKASCAIGKYTIVATDANGLTAETLLNVVELAITVTAKGPFYTGNWVTFELISNAPTKGNITIIGADGIWDERIDIFSDPALWRDLGDGTFTYRSSAARFLIDDGNAPTTNATKAPYTWTSDFDDAGNKLSNPPTGEFDVYKSTKDDGTGSVGPAGPAGSDGKDGAPGAKGDAGAAGPAGSAGAKGANGANGANGATGPQGDAGAPGAPGADGADAPTGTLTAALIVAIIALIVGGIAAFLVITMRRKVVS